MDAQLKENEAVKEELDLLGSDNAVYKSVGPVLIKTDLVEAKQNVAKRIDYITNELKRIDDQLVALEKKEETHRQSLLKLQQIPLAKA